MKRKKEEPSQAIPSFATALWAGTSDPAGPVMGPALQPVWWEKGTWSFSVDSGGWDAAVSAGLWVWLKTMRQGRLC